jgi:hypothetical protein
MTRMRTVQFLSRQLSALFAALLERLRRWTVRAHRRPTIRAMAWWDQEAELRALARAHDPVLTELADRGFALYRRATENRAMMGRWEHWEAIMALNLQQAENSAAAAWELAYTGYYVQAGALARLITEYLAVVWYLPNHPEDADKWNDTGVRAPEAGHLLKDVFANDPAVNEAFGSLRKHVLHRYAHQDPRGLKSILGKAEPGGVLEINARGMFDPDHFEYIARVLLPLHASVPMAFNQWRGHLDSAWRRDAIAYRDGAAAWLDEKDARDRAEKGSEGATASAS